MSKDASGTEYIEREIDNARTQLAVTVNELVYRTSPARVAEKAKRSVRDLVASPAVQAAGALVAAVVVVVVIRRIRR